MSGLPASLTGTVNGPAVTVSMTASLIERLEKATGPDRLLDGLIMAATNPPSDLDGIPANIFIRYEGDYGRFKSFAGTPMSFSKPVPLYTASLDAALTLVPADKDWRVGNMTGLPTATVCTPGAWLSFKTAPTAWHGETPAIALCIAALKARAASESLTHRDVDAEDAGESAKRG